MCNELDAIDWAKPDGDYYGKRESHVRESENVLMFELVCTN